MQIKKSFWTTSQRLRKPTLIYHFTKHVVHMIELCGVNGAGIITIYRKENWGLEWLTVLPKVTGLEDTRHNDNGGGAGVPHVGS